MDKLIFGLCASTAFLCAVLLLRSYVLTRSRLLLWSGLCFIGLTLNNLLLIADRWAFPTVDLSVPKLAAAFAGMILLIYGLVWESE